MEHGDIIFEDGYICLKWKEHGIQVSVELNDELKTAERACCLCRAGGKPFRFALL